MGDAPVDEGPHGCGSLAGEMRLDGGERHGSGLSR